jgi:hypothetical protein
MKRLKFIMPLMFVLLTMQACIEKIDIEGDKGESQYVIEGMIVYDPEDPLKLIKDTIKISRSVPYLFAGEPEKVINATVAIVDTTGGVLNIDICNHVGNGNYVTTTTLPKPNSTYTLLIRLPEGDTLISQSRINRPVIFHPDSFYTRVLTERSNGPGGPIPEGTGYVEMKPIDPAGLGDSYRLKYYVKRNPVASNPYLIKDGAGWKYYNEVRNFNVVSESTAGENSPNAQIEIESTFNFPLRRSINLVEEQEGGTELKPSYYPGDSIKVEVYSITREQLFFYVRMLQELTNGTGGGFAGLFAEPVANVPSNIFPLNPQSKIKALGWFGAAHKITRRTKMVDFSFN